MHGGIHDTAEIKMSLSKCFPVGNLLYFRSQTLTLSFNMIELQKHVEDMKSCILYFIVIINTHLPGEQISHHLKKGHKIKYFVRNENVNAQ